MTQRSKRGAPPAPRIGLDRFLSFLAGLDGLDLRYRVDDSLSRLWGNSSLPEHYRAIE